MIRRPPRSTLFPLHDALPILGSGRDEVYGDAGNDLLLAGDGADQLSGGLGRDRLERSEEHTSELQSRQYLVCRLLLEKKKTHLRSVDCMQYAEQTPVHVCSVI